MLDNITGAADELAYIRVIGIKKVPKKVYLMAWKCLERKGVVHQTLHD